MAPSGSCDPVLAQAIGETVLEAIDKIDFVTKMAGGAVAFGYQASLCLPDGRRWQLTINPQVARAG